MVYDVMGFGSGVILLPGKIEDCCCQDHHDPYTLHCTHLVVEPHQTDHHGKDFSHCDDKRDNMLSELLDQVVDEELHDGTHYGHKQKV